MRSITASTLLFAAALLTGCGVAKSGQQTTAPAYPALTGNWQIQSGTPPGASPASAVVLLGALQNSGANVSGTFRFSNLADITCALNQVIALTGTVDSSGNLTLTSAPLPNGSVIKTQLTVPSVPTDFAKGTIEVTGTSCAFPSSTAVGVQIAPVSGKFAGTLSPGTLGAPAAGTSGTGTLNMEQSSTPSADGQFPVSGTLASTFGSCTNTIAVSGNVSGVGLTLNAVPSFAGGLSPVAVIATTNQTATQVQVGFVLFSPSPCSSDPLSSSNYTGTLLHQ